MNKNEFLKQLDALLSDLPVEERREAMEYYVEYFEEAGPEKEADVIRELGSPGEVAGNIRQELAGKELALRGETANEKKKGTNGWKIAFIVLLCIVVAPVVIPLGIAVAVVMVAAIACVISVCLAVVIGIVASVVACAIVAVALLIVGIVNLFGAPVVGALLIGVSLVSAGVFFLALLLCIKFCTTVLPELVKGIVYLVKLPFRKKEAVK